MVVGLGNPGERYAGTRHNVGFMVVDALASRLGVHFKKKLFHSYFLGKALHEGAALSLVKPLTYMNDSGRAVREAMRETGSDASQLLVVCDSLDLSPGNLRFKLKGSSAGQKGLESVIRVIGTQDFMRLWIGIGRPDREGKVVGHVLSAPPRGEEELLDAAVERAARAVLILLSEGPVKVMNELNRKEPAS
ncbi:MAG: aminoacyl-tRNA hydrolase [Spirochaetia bacterium]